MRNFTSEFHACFKARQLKVSSSQLFDGMRPLVQINAQSLENSLNLTEQVRQECINLRACMKS